MKAFQLNENDIVLENMNLMSLDDAKLKDFDLIYTSAACGGLFDCKLYYLALKYNLGLLCNKATTQNMKSYCDIKATRIAQAEVHKTGAKTDADLSTTENLQRRDIYFVDVHTLYDGDDKSDLLNAWEQFRDWIISDDECNRSTEKNVNQAWFNKIFECVQTQVTQFNADIIVADYTVDINLTYWGNFIGNNSNTQYNIAAPIQHLKDSVNGQRMTDKKWSIAKLNLCKEIITIFQQNTQTINELFPDIDTIILNIEQSKFTHGKTQTGALPLPTQPNQTEQLCDVEEDIKQILIIYTCGTLRDLRSMEYHIEKTFDKWVQMLVYCGEEMNRNKLRDIHILVLGEDKKEWRDLWVDVLQERSEFRFVEILFDDLGNNNQKFHIIIDSQDPATIYDDPDKYFKKLVIKHGFIFLFKMTCNCLDSIMKKFDRYENENYELMTTQDVDLHVHSFHDETSLIGDDEDSTHECLSNDIGFLDRL
jgi:hypothetical protein